MSGLPVLHDIGAVWATKNHLLPVVASGATFIQNGMAYGTAVVGAGTYKLPDDGLPMYVRATGDVIVTTAAGVHVLSMSSGTRAEFIPISSTSWIVGGSFSTVGSIPIPLTAWREITSNDITNASGNGGVLATDTTPTLETVNGDTDGQLRMLWASSNSDAVATQVPLPPDFDPTQDLVLHIRGQVLGSDDEAVMSLDSFFNEGDTKVEDDSVAWNNDVSAIADRPITIAAADIPSNAATVSLELTPGTHATETLTIYSTWLTYKKKLV